MTRSRSHVRVALLIALCTPAVSGCLDHPLKQVEYDNTSVDMIEVDPYVPPKIDVLFVVDNSGSMGEEQATLAANFGAFVDVLEEVDVDYRIGITTTDNGNPWCTGTAAAGGALQLRSCRSHLDDFIFSPGTAVEVDRRQEACLERCPEQLTTLAALPTTTDDDLDPRPRPWLEREAGISNVPEGTTTAQALACWGPQGIAGCGFESPLESMRKTILRSLEDEENGAGFLRDDALLQIVFITDEADCSLGGAGVAAFSADGDQTLWPDPDAPLPPSALCWYAGVSCETTPEGLTHCEPADIGTDGMPAAEGQEVLQPLSRYVDMLDELDAQKRDVLVGAERTVFVSVIGGVPQGYAGEPINYGQGNDPEFASDFGVGAGCTSAQGEAVPPVRLLAFAQSFASEDELLRHGNMFSVCDENYEPALETIAAEALQELAPSCVRTCVSGGAELVDGDLDTCVVTHELDNQSERLPICEPQADGSWRPPAGSDLCAYFVAGNDRHEDCQRPGQNLEFRVERNDGAEIGDIRVACEVSDNADLECPAG